LSTMILSVDVLAAMLMLLVRIGFSLHSRMQSLRSCCPHEGFGNHCGAIAVFEAGMGRKNNTRRRGA